jgi:hypothetical protein
MLPARFLVGVLFIEQVLLPFHIGVAAYCLIIKFRHDVPDHPNRETSGREALMKFLFFEGVLLAFAVVYVLIVRPESI